MASKDERALFDGLRVLLVEDEFLIAADLAEFLGELGCEVVGPVAKVDSAMRLAAREPLDGAIVDMNLAGRSAVPVLSMLDSRDVPAIVTTGYGTSSVPERLQHIPCLSKPVRRLRLIAAMQAAFARRGTTVARC
jgi:DNA-binding NarL/FixJ family response regulator